MIETIKSLSQLKRNMAAGVICSTISALLMACSYPIFLRYLGYEQYGLWLVIGTVLSFTQLSGLGLGQSVSRQVAADHSLGNDDAVDTCVSSAICMLLASGGLACTSVTILRTLIVRSFNLQPTNAGLVASLLPAVAVLSLYAMCLDTLTATLAGIGRIDLYLYLQLLIQVLSTLLAMLLLHQKYGIRSFVIANATAYITVHLLSSFTIRRHLKRKVFSFRRFSWPSPGRSLPSAFT